MMVLLVSPVKSSPYTGRKIEVIYFLVHGCKDKNNFGFRIYDFGFFLSSSSQTKTRRLLATGLSFLGR